MPDLSLPQAAQTPPTPASIGLGSVLNPPGVTPDPKTPEPGQTEDKVSSKLQMLMRREKVALEREAAARASMEGLTTKEKALLEREKRIEEFESVKKTNPRRALELLGMNYNDLTQVELNDGVVPAEIKVKQVEEKFDNYIKTQTEALNRQAEEAQRLEVRKQEEALEQFKGQIKSHLTTNASRYELIGFEQNEDLVYDLIDEHYDRTLKEAQTKAEEEGTDPSLAVGQVMKIADAADKIEQLLEQKYNKARELSKVQALLGPRPGTQSPQVAKPSPQSTSTSPAQKTLTNQLSASAGTPPPAKGIISDDERLKRAIAYARGLRP